MWSCMPGGLREVVLSFKFRQNRLKGFRAVVGRNLPLALGIENSTFRPTVQTVMDCNSSANR